MKNVAARAYNSPANSQFLLKRLLASLGVALALSACASSGATLGLTLPVGRYGGIGVGIGTDGRVSGNQCGHVRPVAGQ
jgi:recombinational DNA repair protein (RecF pathway)